METFERATTRESDISLAGGKSATRKVEIKAVVSLTLGFMNSDGIGEAERKLAEIAIDYADVLVVFFVIFVMRVLPFFGL